MTFHIDYYSKRFIFFGVSAVLLLIGLIGGFVNGGLNFDIQFEGGTHMEIPMTTSDIDTGDVINFVAREFGKAVTAQVQQIYSPDAPDNRAAHLIVKASKSETLNNDQISALQDYLNEKYGVAEDKIVNIQTVEPYIGAEMLQKGLLAVFIASALILLYVWIRFSVMSGLSAAICATIALIHDALIVLAVYAVFRIPINESFIAAVLTIIGYSINDTIIVYDRIRENAKSNKKLPHVDLINNSLNQTLKRSLNTVITTLICVVTVYIFAVIYDISSLQEFCLPLMIGLVAGVYSTLFIATQLWAMWQIGLTNRRLATAQTKK